METIKIKYLGGNRAREINGFGIEKPKMEKYGWYEQAGFDDLPSGWMVEGGEEAYYEALEQWKEAESNLREFEIEEVTVYNKKELDIEKDVIIKYDGEDIFKLGSTHNAIILENGKVRIV
jgi:hypothetical protein